MDKKTVLISGGAGGIGSCIAKRFRAQAYHVVVLDVEGESLVRMKNEGFSVVPCDLSSASAIESVVERVLQTNLSIDVLVQAAGLMRNANSFQLDEQSWDQMFSVNCKAMFFLAKAVMEKCMMQTGGSIVNFSSAAAIRGFFGSMASPHYAASKGAVISLTRQLACEWGKYHIRVNAIVPGGVLTPAMKSLHFDPTQLQNIPLQRLCDPEDIADVVEFLAGEHAKMITGQAIVVDGGASIVGQ